MGKLIQQHCNPHRLAERCLSSDRDTLALAKLGELFCGDNLARSELTLLNGLNPLRSVETQKFEQAILVMLVGPFRKIYGDHPGIEDRLTGRALEAPRDE